VDFASLEILKTCLDEVLCSLLWVTLLRQGGCTGGSPEVPSNPYNSVILLAQTGSYRKAVALLKLHGFVTASLKARSPVGKKRDLWCFKGSTSTALLGSS